jgi:hypothetical protein
MLVRSATCNGRTPEPTGPTPEPENLTPKKTRKKMTAEEKTAKWRAKVALIMPDASLHGIILDCDCGQKISLGRLGDLSNWRHHLLRHHPEAAARYQELSIRRRKDDE